MTMPAARLPADPAADLRAVLETATVAAAGIPAARRYLVIAGCSARKAACPGPVSALELYTGGCAPQLRERLAGHPDRRARVRFLSAEHGLVRADTLLTPYDRRLELPRAQWLRPRVWARLSEEFERDGLPEEILLILEPLYLVALADLLAHTGRPPLRWVADPHGWPEVATILDRWSW